MSTSANPESAVARRPGWMVQTILALIVACGVGLVGFTLATNLFGKTQSAEDLISATRSGYTQQSIDQARQDVATTQGTMNALRQQALPALAAQLHLTPQQLQALLNSQFPAVATGLAQVDGILQSTSQRADVVEANIDNFQQTDAIPTGWLPMTAVPWSMLIIGVVFILAGGIPLIWPRMVRPMLATAGIVGVATVATLLATSMYGKTQAADTLSASQKETYTQQAVDQRRAETVTLTAMSAQLQTQVIPALAAQLHVTPAQLTTTLATTYPAIGTGLAEFPQIIARRADLVAVRQNNLANYSDAAAIPWSGGSVTYVFWAMMVPAVLVLLLAGGGLLLVGFRPGEVPIRQRLHMPHLHHG